jgi:cytochrome oxidase assembly protein ShyY1
MIAKHNVGNDTRPAIFFWYDVPSMISVTKEDGLAIQTGSADAAATSTTIPSSNATLVLLTQVDANDEKQPVGNSKKAETNWPLAPTSTSLIDGRIHPIMHAGYAVTWFGLCIAGMIMTRRLSTVPHHAAATSAATAAKNGASSAHSPASAATLKQASTKSPPPISR